MKWTKALYVLAVLALAAGCAVSTASKDLQVKSWSKPGVDFIHLTAYAWKPGTDRGSAAAASSRFPGLVDHIRRLIVNEMSGRGFKLTGASKAELWVSFIVVPTAASRPGADLKSTSPMNPRPIGSSYERTGFLQVSIGVAGSDTPAWTGTVTGKSAGLLRHADQVEAAVHRVLAEFPPL